MSFLDYQPPYEMSSRFRLGYRDPLLLNGELAMKCFTFYKNQDSEMVRNPEGPGTRPVAPSKGIIIDLQVKLLLAHTGRAGMTRCSLVRGAERVLRITAL